MSDDKGGFDPESMTTPFLLEIAEKMKASISIKDRTYHLKTYKSCFVGTDAVAWMINTQVAHGEADAVIIGNQLLGMNVIYHVTKDQPFANGKYFYRFTEDDDRGSSAKDENGNPISWHSVGKLLAKVTIDEDKDSELNTDYASYHEEQTNESSMTGFDIGISPLDEHNVTLLNNVHPKNWINPQKNGDTYSLLVIGAGTAGLVSSAGSAGLGIKVAIIDEHLMGGDCLNVGCVPSKAFIRAARAVKEVQEAGEFGITFDSPPKVDFGVAMARLRRLRAQISHHDSYERFSKELGVDVYQGRARFVSKDTVEVGGQQLRFQKAVVATGASAAIPPIDGLVSVPFLTNASVFNLTELPPRVIVIGAGPIGLEMAQSFARFGSKVTVFVRGKQLLPKEDQDAAAIVYEQLVEDGLDIHFESKYVKISQTKEGNKFNAPFNEILVDVEIKGEAQSFACDALLIATGRKPNVENMGLEEAGIEYDTKTGVHINKYCQTSNKNVYACGDVCTKFQFTHMADFMARTVIRNALFFGSGKHTALLVPWATFTEPEVAHVGLYEADMIKKGIEFDTYTKNFDDVDRAICDGDTKGFVKVHTKKGTDTILGATIVNPNAGNMISELSVAMANKIGLGSLGAVIHPYPTQAEAIRMCGDLYNKTRLTPTVKGLLSSIGNRKLF